MASRSEQEAFLREHLNYEMLMLRHTAARLPKISDQLEWNVHFVAFVVHARNFYDFLTWDSDTRNFSAKNYGTFKAEKDNDTTGRFGRVHGQVLHLGKTRPGDRVTLGDVEALANWVEEKFCAFRGTLDAGYQTCWDEQAATPPSIPTLVLSLGPHVTPQATGAISITGPKMGQ